MQPFDLQRRAVWRQVILDAVAAAAEPLAVSDIVEVIGLTPGDQVIRKILDELVAEGRVTKRVVERSYRDLSVYRTSVYAIARRPAKSTGRRPAKRR